MKFASTMTLAAVALAVSGSAMIAVQPAQAKKKEEAAPAAGPVLTKAVHAALFDAQKALDAGDTATADAKIAEAQAAAVTPNDKYYVAGLQFKVANKANDDARQLAATKLMVDSGAAPAETLPVLLQNEGALAYRAKDYVTTEAAYTRLVELKPNDADSLVALAEIQYDNKKAAQALETSKRAVAAKKASGVAVPENWYKRPLAIAYESKLAPQSMEWSQALVEAYPTADNWRTALSLYRDGSGLDEQGQLDVYRLQNAAKALKGERDYYDYASSAYDRGLPGEAKAVLDSGVAAKMVDPANASIKELRTVAASKTAADRAALAGLDTRARAAADAKPAMNTASAYFGYGDYAKAADLYRVALQKSGVDANRVNIRLGMALAMAGQKPAALEAFNAVAPGSALAPLAHYWTIWLGQQS